MQLRFSNPKLERFIDSKVKSGHFPTREAVVEDALSRMMDEEILLTDDDLAQIEEGDKAIDRGEFVEFDEFASRMRTKYGIKK
jgi:Arc/MetJ-type ribon-helix-helix transcriptional regulator